MIRACLFFIGVLSSLLFAESEPVSLSGTVKDTDGNGIEGVNVSLAVKSDLSDMTDAGGAFALTGGTSVINGQSAPGALAFTFRGNSVVFAPTAQQAAGSMAVFSSDGKRVAYARLSGFHAGERRIPLPELGSGVYVIQIELNGEVHTRSMVCMGSELFLENHAETGREGSSFRLTKRTAGEPVDTIIAEKEGYVTEKTPVTSYTQENIEIVMEAEGTVSGECTRESMKAIVDKYIEAQEAGNPSLMPFAEGAMVFENTEEKSPGESFISNAMTIDLHRSFYDVDSCRTFTEVIVATTNPTAVMGVSFRIAGEKITEVKAIVTREGDWLYNASDYLKYSKQEEEEWYILPEEERPSREFLIDAGDQYLDLFKKDTSDIPWGAPCARLEGGAYTNANNNNRDNCHFVNTQGALTIGGRDYIVDVAMGTSIVFCAFCTLDSHLFRLIDGHFRFVHTLTVGC